MSADFALRHRLTPVALRETNLAIWRQGPAYYFGAAKQWWRPESEVLRGINKPTYDVQAMIDAVWAYPSTDDGLRACWAHHMAMHAGCHAWPNANHRTAMLAFNAVARLELGLLVGFTNPTRGKRLVEDSHRQRDADGGEYTTQALSSEAHPYREIFARAAEDLAIVPVKDTHLLAPFGPREEG
jgi:hypothetical protein